MLLETRIVSSLEKVFCSERLDAPSIDRISLLRGEVGAFQITFRAEEHVELSCVFDSPLKPHLSLREVGLVPCLLPAMPDDPFVLTREPGVFPDPLPPVSESVVSVPGRWNALWVTAAIPPDAEPGEYEVGIRLHCAMTPSAFSGGPAPRDFHLTFRIEVLEPVLAPQKLKNTLWFYADCIKSCYGVESWSERHWEILGNYIRDFVAHGGNMLYTPLWSVPLDTMPGAERPTVQLLKIRDENGVYRFDFSRLERWIELARSCGVEYFEFSHAFTQWGAKATPKIVVETAEGEEKRFGWQVAADSPEYRKFLSALLPELENLLVRLGLKDKSYFHISDEPGAGQLEDYRRAKALVVSRLPGFKIIDALSSPEFVRSGVTRSPVPATSEIEEFAEFDLAERWIYYCGNYQNGLPNRQFGMPSARNRIFGVLLYLYRLDGLLNWGYNFWYSQYSRNQEIDPWQVTDAGRAFCGGGGFMVYPGKDGKPVDSIRFEVFREALQDLRALQMLEAKIGREEVEKMIREGVDFPLSFTRYPRSAQWLLDLRARVNAALVCRRG